MMKVLTKTVIDGRIDPSFTLTPDQLEAIQTSIDQASKGQVVDGRELLADLGS